MLEHIQFTKIEAEAIEHRLQFLADAEDEDLEELFDEDSLRISDLRDFAASTVELFQGGNLKIVLSSKEAIAALVEAVEGATIQQMADEAEQDGRITQQKVNAYRRALSTAAKKLGIFTEPEVYVPH